MSNKKNLVLVAIIILVAIFLIFFYLKNKAPRELTQEEKNALIRAQLDAFVPDPNYVRKTPEEIRAELDAFKPSTSAERPTNEEVRKQLEGN